MARGLEQREGIDFFENVAPTPAASCFRLEEDVLKRLPQGCGEVSGKSRKG